MGKHGKTATGLVSHSTQASKSLEGPTYWSTNSSTCQGRGLENICRFWSDRHCWWYKPISCTFGDRLGNRQSDHHKFQATNIVIWRLIDKGGHANWPAEGQGYVKLVHSEGQCDCLDHIYNVMYSRNDYVNPTIDKKLSWRSVSSCTSDSGEALENWHNRMHEVSMRICIRIIWSLWNVGAETSEIPTYEGLPNLASFLVEFEAKVTKS